MATATRKHPAPGQHGGACIELANLGAIRDSKNLVGPPLHVDVAGLVARVKAGSLNH